MEEFESAAGAVVDSKLPIRRKIIQIVALPAALGQTALLYALCDDGRVFQTAETFDDDYVWAPVPTGSTGTHEF